MAIVVGHYLKSGKSLDNAQSAIQQLEHIIDINRNNTDKYKGIPIERFFRGDQR